MALLQGREYYQSVWLFEPDDFRFLHCASQLLSYPDCSGGESCFFHVSLVFVQCLSDNKTLLGICKSVMQTDFHIGHT